MIIYVDKFDAANNAQRANAFTFSAITPGSLIESFLRFILTQLLAPALRRHGCPLFIDCRFSFA